MFALAVPGVWCHVDHLRDSPDHLRGRHSCHGRHLRHRALDTGSTHRDHRLSRSRWTRCGPMLLATGWSLKAGKRQLRGQLRCRASLSEGAVHKPSGNERVPGDGHGSSSRKREQNKGSEVEASGDSAHSSGQWFAHSWRASSTVKFRSSSDPNPYRFCCCLPAMKASTVRLGATISPPRSPARSSTQAAA